MKFDLYKPCHDCPFLKKGGIRLTTERVDDICDSIMQSSGNHTFPCHKTTVEDGEGELVVAQESRHCAGAIIFMEKQEKSNNILRIMERLGVYDYKKFMEDEEAVQSVFDNKAQMAAVNEEENG